MINIEIHKAKTKEDCKVCDEYLSKLINFESSFDAVINPHVSVSGPCENNIKQNDVFIAVTKIEQTVGYIFGYRQFSKGKIYNKDILILEALYVEPEFRNQGVGKKLINAFESWAKENYEDFVIEITHINSNENARKFYESLGYLPVKTTLRK